MDDHVSEELAEIMAVRQHSICLHHGEMVALFREVRTGLHDVKTIVESINTRLAQGDVRIALAERDLSQLKGIAEIARGNRERVMRLEKALFWLALVVLGTVVKAVLGLVVN